MIVIDTNVLIYAADSRSDFNSPCRDFIEDRMNDPTPTYLTWNICYEFLRVATHPRVFARPWTAEAAMNFIQVILDSETFSILEHTERHTALLAETLSELRGIRGNLVHDMHTAVLMREHGINQICTRDTDFLRFPFLSIIDPLRL